MSVVFVTHHVQCMCCIILSSLSCLSVPYFLHYLINNMTVGQKVMEQNVRFDFFFTTSVKQFSF